MKFEITETRSWDGDKPPAPGAVAELDEQNRRRWYVEIETLEQLLELQKAVDNELIISEFRGKVSLEVYNDYRE